MPSKLEREVLETLCGELGISSALTFAFVICGLVSVILFAQGHREGYMTVPYVCPPLSF